jgi:hypothetical protein
MESVRLGIGSAGIAMVTLLLLVVQLSVDSPVPLWG